MPFAKQCCVLQEGLNEGNQNAEDCPSGGRVARRGTASLHACLIQRGFDLQLYLWGISSALSNQKGVLERRPGHLCIFFIAKQLKKNKLITEDLSKQCFTGYNLKIPAIRFVSKETLGTSGQEAKLE